MTATMSHTRVGSTPPVSASDEAGRARSASDTDPGTVLLLVTAERADLGTRSEQRGAEAFGVPVAARVELGCAA
jgi:hypothetical protein